MITQMRGEKFGFTDKNLENRCLFLLEVFVEKHDGSVDVGIEEDETHTASDYREDKPADEIETKHEKLHLVAFHHDATLVNRLHCC